MRVSQAVDDYMFAITHLSKPTQYFYKRALAVFVDWCESQQPPLQLEDVKQTVIRRYTDFIRKMPNKRPPYGQLSSYTIQGYIRSLSAFLHWAHLEDGMEDLVTSKTIERIQLPQLDKVVKEVFKPGDIKKLIEAACGEGYSVGAKGTFGGVFKPYPELAARSTAVIAVLADTGIRASELCGLTLENTHMEPGNSYIKVMGKGRKERVVGLGKDTSKYLNRYLKRYRLKTGYRHADPNEKHTFLTRDRKPMTVSGLDQMLYRLGKRAGMSEGYVHAHKFRHTFAFSSIEAGMDVFVLSRVMGHTSTDITMLYLNEFKSEQARVRTVSVFDRLNTRN